MSLLPSAAPIPTNYAQQSGSAYPSNIDAELAAFLRIAGPFAPRALPTPGLALTVDPGSLFIGGEQVEIGGWASVSTTNGSPTVSLVSNGTYLGLADGQSLIAYLYTGGSITYAFSGNNGVSLLSGTNPVTAINNASASLSNAVGIFGQPIGSIGCATGTLTNGSNTCSSMTNTYGMFVGMAFSSSVSGVPSGAIMTAVTSSSVTWSGGNFSGTTTSAAPVNVTVPLPTSSGYARIDRVCISQRTGAAIWVEGTQSNTHAVPPAIPAGYLPCCAVQTVNNISGITTSALTNQSSLVDERQLGALGCPFPVVGSMRNLVIKQASSTTLTITADEIVVAAALGGGADKIANLSVTLNIGNIGINGVDTSSTLTSAMLYVYATSGYGQADGAFATIAGSGSSIYGGSHIPSGFGTAALICAIPLDSSGHFPAFGQQDRTISVPNSLMVSGGGNTSYGSGVSIASFVPPCAKTISGFAVTASGDTVSLAGNASGAGGLTLGGNAILNNPFGGIPLFTAQTLFYMVSAGTTNISLSQYTI